MKVPIEEIQQLLESGIVDKNFEKEIIGHLEGFIEDDKYTNLELVKVLNTLSKHHVLFGLQLLTTSGNNIEEIESIMIEGYVTNITRMKKVLREIESES